MSDQENPELDLLSLFAKQRREIKHLLLGAKAEWNGILSEELSRWSEAIRELKSQAKEEGRGQMISDMDELKTEVKMLNAWMVEMQEFREEAEAKLEIFAVALDR